MPTFQPSMKSSLPNRKYRASLPTFESKTCPVAFTMAVLSTPHTPSSSASSPISTVSIDKLWETLSSLSCGSASSSDTIARYFFLPCPLCPSSLSSNSSFSGVASSFTPSMITISSLV
ncbi:disease resistance protein [Striga asiatica]|uniref:Disease resistance protein n=1 Tax=Striga asiatica TaxID=4170 RepID=A0A5A7PFB5_STRAF|nr:disease resistance protein [Striga asiatica]